MTVRPLPGRIRVAVVAIAAVVSGCRDASCLRGQCPTPCAQLAFVCTPLPLYVGRVADAPFAYRLRLADGADDDVLLSNGSVTAVLSALDAPIDLAPTGGNLIDYGPAGGYDDVTLVYQVAGLLPDDAFAYRTLMITSTPGAVGVTLQGTLDGRPEVDVVTRYELGGCDPGLRVRSELFNGSADVQAFFVADGWHWGKRRVVPFVPVEGQGYLQPELDLLDLTAQWQPYPLAAGAAPNTESSGYASIACDREELSGINDLEISALGTPMTYVEPGDTVVLERLLVTAGGGQGPAPAIDGALAARSQLVPTPTTRIHGTIVGSGAGSYPVGGDVRRVSVVIRDGDRPLTAVVPGNDGTFEAVVPGHGPFIGEVWSFGRKLADYPFGTPGDPGNFASYAVPLPATVQLRVTRGAEPIWALVTFHPADEATRASVTGTFHGRFGPCAPWLGPQHGGSPACNQVHVGPQGAEVEVPAGRYHVFATAGPEHTLAMAEIELVDEEVEAVAFNLVKLDVAPPGWLSADLHVHGRASFDSMIPDVTRAQSFAAQGVAVIAATDHDVIGDYSVAVTALGLDGRIAVMGGLEATQVIPWLDIPGADLPRVIGHFNFWPLRRLPGAPRGGAPSDEYLEPGELFDQMEPLVGPHGLMMLNHPWAGTVSGRHQGYLRAIDFDPRLPVEDRATNNPMLLARPGRHRNVDWNVIEIINGADQVLMQQAIVLWRSLLAQGFVVPGTGNSDSHGMTDAQLGWSRNWVDVRTTVAAFDADVFNDSIRDGRFVAGNGIVLTVEVGPPAGPRRGLGLTPYAVGPGDVVAITVRAPPWVPVDEVRIVTSAGTRVIASGAQLTHPADPFGTAGVLRYEAMVPVRDLITRDDFLIVEAGLAYPDAADLDDDGVPDTTDNNGDGVIDQRDVEPDEDSGPFSVTPDPRDPSDPRYWVTRVVPGAWPMGFANPLILDLDGGGWLPPGLR